MGSGKGFKHANDKLGLESMALLWEGWLVSIEDAWRITDLVQVECVADVRAKPTSAYSMPCSGKAHTCA